VTEQENKKIGKIRTRFAPSPTGSLHIGGLRTAAYALALAKHSNGDFILRIEDTDQKRLIKGATEKLQETLKTFGLFWDEYYVQSERSKKGVYQKEAERLVRDGHAFYCQCTPKNAKKQGYSEILRDTCRDKNLNSGAIKLKIPDNEKVSYTDFVLEKEINWDTSLVSDTTLLKSDGFPTYHLAVVVDDHYMNISHVLRGHDWLPSTPIHLLVYKFLGFERPIIGHLTDILDPDGGKLSKRKGSVSCEAMIKEGYLPEAILNFVILLGWAPKDNREIYTLNEFIEVFDSKGFQKSNPVFNREKLDWFNGYYIRQKNDEELLELLKPFIPKGANIDKVKAIIPYTKDRIKKLTEFPTLAGFVFSTSKEVEPEIVSDPNQYVTHISNATQSLEKVNNWNLASVNEALSGTIQEHSFKTGGFYMDLRTTISGTTITPPINESIEIIGREETLTRLKKGLEKAKK